MFMKSVRNVPQSVLVPSMGVNGYDLLAARKVVITESALQELMKVKI